MGEGNERQKQFFSNVRKDFGEKGDDGSTKESWFSTAKKKLAETMAGVSEKKPKAAPAPTGGK